MRRMAAAIERAIAAVTIFEKDNAARWAAAWGLLCGIKTKPVSVKRSDVIRLHDVNNAELVAASIHFSATEPAAENSDNPAFMPAAKAPHSGDSSSQA